VRTGAEWCTKELANTEIKQYRLCKFDLKKT